jgi:hypothetical protein
LGDDLSPLSGYFKSVPVFFLEVNMTALTQLIKPNLARIAIANKRNEFMVKSLPRRVMLASLGLICAGLSIPMLMLLHLLPTSLFLGLVGFLLVLMGGISALIHCGEI